MEPFPAESCVRLSASENLTGMPNDKWLQVCFLPGVFDIAISVVYRAAYMSASLNSELWTMWWKAVAIRSSKIYFTNCLFSQEFSDITKHIFIEGLNFSPHGHDLCFLISFRSSHRLIKFRLTIINEACVLLLLSACLSYFFDLRGLTLLLLWRII